MEVVDEVFRAIAHPVRRQMIAMLSASPMSVKELTASFTMSQPAISQHLRELREVGLVAADRNGVEQRYRVTGAPLKSVYEWSASYRRFFDRAGHAWALVPNTSARGKARHGR